MPCGRRAAAVARVLAAGALAAAAGAAILLGGCRANPPDAAPAPIARAGVAAGAPVPLRLLAFNDFHGHLQPSESGAIVLPDPADPSRRLQVASGGAAHLAALIRERRAHVPNTLVVSAGDLVGASPLTSALFLDEPTIEVMNLIGLDVNVVGNHEFDKGRAALDRLVRGGCLPAVPQGVLESCARPRSVYPGAAFPFLAANVVDAEGRPIHAPYLVRTFEGVRIGLIGVVTRTTPTIVVPTGVAGLRFEDEADTINRYVRELRGQGVEAIVALIHEGGETGGGANDPACPGATGALFGIVDRLDAAVDLVVSGHTHRAYNCVRNGIRVTQAAAYGRLLTQVDVEIDRATGDVIRDRVQAVNLPVPNGLDDAPGVRAKFPPLAPDPEVQRLVETYARLAAPKAAREVGRVTATIGRGASRGGDSAAGRLVADAHLEATRARGFGEAVVAFTNPGGLRSDLGHQPASGVVTYGDVFRMQPFGNSLVTMTLTGAQIHALLEQQWSEANAERPRLLQPSAGFAYRWDGRAPAGRRVVPSSLQLDGALVRPEGRYRVTVNSFLADGGDGFSVLTQGTDRTGGKQDIDALIDFLRGRSPVAPDGRPRITRLD